MRLNDHGNILRSAPLDRRQDRREIYYDVPSTLNPGWRIGGEEYPETRDLRGSRSNDVATRRPDYVPYQSIFEPDGRHAYDPAARQYPQSGWAERQNWRRAESLADRSNAWSQARPSQLTHPLGESTILHVYGVDNANGDPTRLLYPVSRGGNNIPLQMTSSRPPDPRVYAAQPSPWNAYGNAGAGTQGPGGSYGGFGGGYGTC